MGGSAGEFPEGFGEFFFGLGMAEISIGEENPAGMCFGGCIDGLAGVVDDGINRGVFEEFAGWIRIYGNLELIG